MAGVILFITPTKNDNISSTITSANSKGTATNLTENNIDIESSINNEHDNLH